MAIAAGHINALDAHGFEVGDCRVGDSGSGRHHPASNRHGSALVWAAAGGGEGAPVTRNLKHLERGGSLLPSVTNDPGYRPMQARIFDF